MWVLDVRDCYTKQTKYPRRRPRELRNSFSEIARGSSRSSSPPQLPQQASRGMLRLLFVHILMLSVRCDLLSRGDIDQMMAELAGTRPEARAVAATMRDVMEETARAKAAHAALQGRLWAPGVVFPCFEDEATCTVGKKLGNGQFGEVFIVDISFRPHGDACALDRAMWQLRKSGTVVRSA